MGKLPPMIPEEDDKEQLSDDEEEPTTASSGKAQSFGDAPTLENPFYLRPPGLYDDDAFDEVPMNQLQNIVIMKNIPQLCSPPAMLKELEISGFQHGTDFNTFFMPVNADTGAHFGYGILQFNERVVRNLFITAFHGKLADSAKKVPYVVSVATVEGLSEIFRCKVESEKRKPVWPSPKRQAVNFCPWCGERADGSYNFCPSCGGSLAHNESPSATGNPWSSWDTDYWRFESQANWSAVWH
jgi:hypothetical protein